MIGWETTRRTDGNGAGAPWYEQSPPPLVDWGSKPSRGGKVHGRVTGQPQAWVGQRPTTESMHLHSVAGATTGVRSGTEDRMSVSKLISSKKTSGRVGVAVEGTVVFSWLWGDSPVPTTLAAELIPV